MLLILVLSSIQIAKVRKNLHYISDVGYLLRYFGNPIFRSNPVGITTQNGGSADYKGLPQGS